MTSGRAIYLSHPLSPRTPAYAGGQGLTIEPVSRIADGRTANSDAWHLPNHLGTHVDLPSHFFDDGPTLDSYDASFWIFVHPQLIEVHCEDGYLVVPEDLGGALKLETDLLLLRTGFEKCRGDERYWSANPGLSADLGFWIRENYPNLRALGLDTISATSLQKRFEGAAAHRAFLDPAGNGSPVLLLEDMHLSPAPVALRQVIVSPLRIEGTNGSPCTVIAF